MGPMCPKSVMEEEVTPETALQQVPGPNILFNKCVQQLKWAGTCCVPGRRSKDKHDKTCAHTLIM